MTGSSSIDEPDLCSSVGRLRSHSEILRRGSSKKLQRTLLNSRALSDSGVCDSDSGFHNAAFESHEHIEQHNRNCRNASLNVRVPSPSGTAKKDSTCSGKSDSDKNDSETKGGFSCSLSRYKGVILALLSTMIISFSTLTVALLAGSVKSNEVVFAQMFIELLFSIPLLTLERASLWLPRKVLALVLYRAMIGSIGTSLAFFAFQVMPIGNAKAIIYSSPVFTGLFSCILLREPCTALDVLLSIVTLSGVLLVIQPPFIFGGDQTSSTILGPIFCIIVAILVGTVYITLRKIGNYRINASVILVYFSIVGMITSAILCTALREWVIPRCGMDRILLFLTGSLQFVQQVFVTLALRYEKATTVSLIRTADVLFTFVLDYLFFGIIPNFITISGAVLIIGSLVGITLRKWWSEKKMMKETEAKDQKSDHGEENLDQEISSEDFSVTQ